MRKTRIFGFLLAITLLGVLVTGAAAQTYYFGVDRLEVHVYINQDNTMSLEYVYQFNNAYGGDAIEAVDIGLPTTDYDMGSITAQMGDGTRITNIGSSPYVSGIAVELGSQAIRPGASGTLQVNIPTVRGTLFIGQTINNEEYASFNFMPNYFDSQYVNGKTDMTVVLYLPPGLEPDQPRFYTPTGWPGTKEPESGYDAEGRVFYRWRTTEASPSGQYKFGASFPSRLIDQSALIRPTIWQKLGIDSEAVISASCCLGFAGFFLWVTIASAKAAKKRKMQYLPPKIALEGHGIKRGLTAIEAAILMEQPLDKVLTMMLFSSVKKNAATVISKEPLKIKASDPLPESLQTYERAFLEAFQKEKPAERQKGLQDMMVEIVKELTEKMKGFSRKETVAYYENIMKQAWAQVETAGTPQVKSEKYDQVMEWTMLDKDYEGHTRDVFGSGPVYVPMWWGRFDPTYSAPSTASSSQPSVGMPSGMGGGTSVNLPSLPGSSFAASVVNTVQNFSSNVVGDISNFTSSITNRTNPVPVSTSSSRGGSRSGGGGGGGGRSCACACACAGCACACAGGGR